MLRDTDLDNAINEAVTNALSFNGQRCTALKVLFVPAAVVDLFLDKLNARIAGLKAGIPGETCVSLTPTPSMVARTRPKARSRHHDALRVFSIWTLVATRFDENNKILVNDIIRQRQSVFLSTDYIF